MTNNRMTEKDIVAIIKVIEEHGVLVTPSLVLSFARLSDPTITIDYCKVTIDAREREKARQAKLEAEREAFSKLSEAEQAAYVAAWEEDQYCSNK